MRLKFLGIPVLAALLSVAVLVPVTSTRAASAAPAASGVTNSGNTFSIAYNGTTTAGKVLGNVSGTLSDGTPFTGGTITFSRFAVQQGRMIVMGTFSATNATTGAPISDTFSAPVSVGDPTCQILTLHVGAINLDLLGLVVTTSPIDLNITAQSGPGNLLGNLLCAVANLLNQPSSLQQVLNSLVQALNQLLASL